MIDKISRFITSEINRIPLYNNGKAFIRFYDQDWLHCITNEKVETMNDYIPYSDSAAFRSGNIQLISEVSVSAFIKQAFDKGFSDINLFSGADSKMMNGILYVKKT